MSSKRPDTPGQLVRFVAFAAIVVALGYLLWPKLDQVEAKCNGKPCNVILIVADTLSAKHMSTYGYSRQTTPFVDEFFGKQGIVFDQASSNASWTVPSFASFYTSQLPSEIYVERTEDKLSAKIPTFQQVMRKAGVKLQYFHVSPFLLLNRGVLESFEPFERTSAADPLVFLSGAEWIKQQASGTPFFALVHTFVVHDPYAPPADYQHLFNAPATYPGAVYDADFFAASNRTGGPTQGEIENFTRQYDQEVRYLDDLLKDFFAQIPKGTLDQTVVILTADHGEGFWEHGLFWHGNSVYEELLHVPFLVRMPGTAPHRVTNPMQLLDLGPTILDALGLSSPSTFRGVSLLPELLAGTVDARQIMAESAEVNWPGKQAFANQAVEIRNKPVSLKSDLSIRFGPWKLLQKKDRNLELYNLNQDPDEQQNLIEKWAEIADEDKTTTTKLFQFFSLPVPTE